MSPALEMPVPIGAGSSGEFDPATSLPKSADSVCTIEHTKLFRQRLDNDELDRTRLLLEGRAPADRPDAP